jgi:hypothetical protein
MIKSMKNIVLDSHAILKWTQMEAGYKKVKSLAIRHNATILTGDPEFKKTEKLVKVEWVL